MKKLISIIFYLISVLLVTIGIICCSKGFNKKDEYSYDNQYVGGDAYNYIINGTYFSGYMALASGMFITSAVLVSAGTIIILKVDSTEYIINELNNRIKPIDSKLSNLEIRDKNSDTEN